MSKQQLALSDPAPIDEDALLETDARWIAMQRILASSGFQRAAQLRKILIYITTSVVLRPEQSVREYEIACDVLGRRPDFDPLDDNIVRAQMSHLRRKLETYYLEEGRTDPLQLSIPKGSYLPHFTERRQPMVPSEPASPTPLGIATRSSPHSPPHVVSNASASSRRGLLILLSVTCFLLLVTTGVLVRKLVVANAPKAAVPVANSFVQFLAHLSSPVKIVLPDLSLVIVQTKFDTNLTLQEYARPDYLQSHIDTVKDPDYNYLLSMVRNMRNTS